MLSQSKDGVLFCSHDLGLGEVSDVNRTEFVSRKRILQPDGTVDIEQDWWFADFQSSEIHTLKVKQFIHDPKIRSQLFNLEFKIPTFEEMITFVQQRADQLNRTIDIIPEIKHSTYHQEMNAAQGRDKWFMEKEVLRILESKGYVMKGDKAGEGPSGRVMIQSAEFDSLKYLRQHTDIPLMALIFGPDSTEGRTRVAFDWYLTPSGLDTLAETVQSVGIWKEYLLQPIPTLYANSVKYASDDWRSSPVKKDIKSLGGYISPDQLVRAIHERGLTVAAWTFRNAREDIESVVVTAAPYTMTSDTGFEDLMSRFMSVGVDYLFVEKVSDGICARTRFIDASVRDFMHSYSITTWRLVALLFGLILFIIILVLALLYYSNYRCIKNNYHHLTSMDGRNSHGLVVGNLHIPETPGMQVDGRASPETSVISPV